MTSMNPKVDGFLRNARKWRAELTELRRIILDFELTEELKWGKPCYTFQEHNLVVIQGFKEYCAYLFFKGALLRDPEGILVKPGENTQAGRQIRFASLPNIVAMETSVRAYILEAIEIERAGLKVKLRKSSELSVPAEFLKKSGEVPALQTAFAALTPGRQRAYLMHFSAARQSRTREARIEKWLPHILNGKGLNDQ